MAEGRAHRSALAPFLVMPLVETPRALRRSPGVVAIIIVSFAVVAAGGPWPSVTRTIEATSDGLADGELWRLVTYVFPHERGWPHVVVNMVVLSLFGWQLEQIIGARRFLVIYLGSGAIGMCLLSAANPIEAERGLRGGASLAVFGVVAALTTIHAVTSGLSGPAMPSALSTCFVLLTAGGVLASGGRGDAIPAGLDGFRFGFLNHSCGMIGGLLLGLAVPACSAPATRRAAAAVALIVSTAALALGAHRWT